MPAMAWFEGVSDNCIRWSEAQPEDGEAAVEVLGDRRTGRAVALAGDTTSTYMAWKGLDQRIWWSHRHRGGRWSPRKSTGFQTLAFPSLGRLGNRTFLAFRQEEPDFRPPSHQQYTIRWAELRGENWDAGPEDLGLHFVDENVSLTEHGGCLHLFWRRTFDSRVCRAVFDGSWTVVGPVADWRTSTPPAVASDGTCLHVAWRRVEDDRIGWATISGDRPRSEVVLGDRRAFGAPALGRSGDGELVLVWRDPAGGGLWWSRCRDLRWEPRWHEFAHHRTEVWHGVSLA
ncbi:hypothetical protein A4R43_40045 [Amycolatopsis albispora]|uniref:Uncharacterized protein n=2 Tax=Amycolatopsis albispora TaxID=1804986 RepID=A0A344LIK9_9PSEU|nr:hypothetical protein A4R43_40045 [Amycolatopsis albispora]